LAALKESYNITPHKDSNGNYSFRPFSPLMQGISPSMGISANWESSVDGMLRNDNLQRKESFSEFFGNYFVTHLRTEDRLRLINEASTQNMYTEIGSCMSFIELAL
jgi:hypothetical protein